MKEVGGACSEASGNAYVTLLGKWIVPEVLLKGITDILPSYLIINIGLDQLHLL